MWTWKSPSPDHIVSSLGPCSSEMDFEIKDIPGLSFEEELHCRMAKEFFAYRDFSSSSTTPTMFCWRRAPLVAEEDFESSSAAGFACCCGDLEQAVPWSLCLC